MQNLTKLIAFVLFSLLLTNCKKRDPAPENKDPVYARLNSDLGEAKAALALIQDNVNSSKADLETAVPQSGERAVFEKRINDGLNAMTYAAQQVRMYEVRIEERKVYVQRRYLESLTANGRPWPDEADIDAELLKLQLFREKTARIRNTLKKDDVPRGTNKPGEGSEKASAASSGHGEEKPAGGSSH